MRALEFLAKSYVGASHGVGAPRENTGSAPGNNETYKIETLPSNSFQFLKINDVILWHYIWQFCVWSKKTWSAIPSETHLVT